MKVGFTMKARKLLSVIITAIVLVIIGSANLTKVQAKYVGHNDTPTELRGNWYQYEGNNKWTHVKITKHAYIINGKTICGSNKKGVKKLYVTQSQEQGGKVYNFNKFKFHYQEVGVNWLSKRKIHGKRVMKSYYNMGYFQVYTRNKLKHKYNYEVNGSKYLKQLGK